MFRVIKRILGLFMLMNFLSSCADAVEFQNVPLSATPTTILAQVGTIVPSETPSADAAGTPIGTPIAEPEIHSGLPKLSMATTASVAGTTPGACLPDPVSQPPWPTADLLPNELDPKTGLHMTGIPQLIDLETYRLEVTGMVDHPLSLTYDELRCMRKVTDNPELVCPGVFTDNASWTGVPIMDILELAGIQSGATVLTLVSADGYEVSLPLETASAERNFLAYEVNGKTLPVQHGFPLRAVFPSMWGSYWLKWLVEIKIS